VQLRPLAFSSVSLFGLVWFDCLYQPDPCSATSVRTDVCTDACATYTLVYSAGSDDRFQELLVKHGFNNGIPIDEAFFRKHISGRHNPVIAAGGHGEGTVCSFA
jgi:hypothetical protein